MTDTVKHMWDQVEKARADGTFSSEHAAVPAQCDAAQPQKLGISFSDAMEIAEDGLRRWREKDHNAKWWRKIDGTPIPNDLLVNIAQSMCEVYVRTPAEVVHPDDFAQFLRDVEREQGNCSDEDTWLGYRQTAEAILEKFDVRPKHSSTMREGE